MADIDIAVGKEPLINHENNNNTNKIFNRCVSHQQDELHSFRKYLRWMCVDHSSPWTAILSWTMFIVFTLVVPAISHFLLACADCDSYHSRPYDSVVQLSLSSVATVSFLCLTRFVSKYGLRRFLFFDKLWDESETVRRNYTNQLNVSFSIFESQFFWFLYKFCNRKKRKKNNHICHKLISVISVNILFF